MKRLLDMFASVCALLVCSPILLVLGILIRLAMGSPVFFRQERPGFRGRVFRLVKFRSMTGARNGLGRLRADAERLTRLGRFLRTTSLDELPTLWNVLKGEMSLVGPRPLLVQYIGRYTPEQARRHEVRPGITGWAQVNGRNALSWEDKFRLDTWYVDHRSLGLDAWIVLLTVWKVLKRDGISQEGEATAREFLGTREGSDGG